MDPPDGSHTSWAPFLIGRAFSGSCWCRTPIKNSNRRSIRINTMIVSLLGRRSIMIKIMIVFLPNRRSIMITIIIVFLSCNERSIIEIFDIIFELEKTQYFLKIIIILNLPIRKLKIFILVHINLKSWKKNKEMKGKKSLNNLDRFCWPNAIQHP